MKKNNTNTITVKIANDKKQAPRPVETDQGSLNFNWGFPKQNFLSSNSGLDNLERGATINDKDDKGDQVEETLKKYLTFEQVDGTDVDVGVKHSVMGNKSKGQKVYLLKKILTPVILALVIGNLIGFFVLYLIDSKDSVDDTKTNASVLSTETGAMSVYNKELRVTLIQAGVFSSEGTLENYKVLLPDNYAKKKFVFDQKYYLFVAVVNSLDVAKSVAATITSEQQTFYWKEVMFDGESKATFTEQQKEKITETKEKFLEMTNILGVIKLAGQDITGEFVQLDSESLGAATALVEKYNGCVNALEQYRNAQTVDNISNLEQLMLDYLSVYHEL